MAALVDDQGSPFYWANAYVVLRYRNRGASPLTSAKVLNTLGMALCCAASRGFNLDDELSTGSFLSVEDANALADFLRLNSESQARELAENLRTRKATKIVRLEQVRGSRAKSANATAVSPLEAATRIRWLVKYLEWHRDIRLGALDRAKKESESLRSIAEIVINTLKLLVPRVKATSDDESLEGLSPEICATAENTFTAGAPLNPFERGFHQERNYLVWRFLYETGMRREELTALEVGKIDYSTRRVQITKSKTLLRTVPISAMLALKFHDFVLDYWAKIPPRHRKHGLLFTRPNGVPLKVSAINLIFRTARKRNSSLPVHFAPHALRRTWNDNFERIAKASGITNSKKLEAIQNRLQGWADNSQMGKKYARGEIRRTADVIAEALVNDLVS